MQKGILITEKLNLIKKEDSFLVDNYIDLIFIRLEARMSLQMEVDTDLKEINNSNDIFTVIKKRHSVRSYTKKMVSEGLIKMLIELATRAPSSMNRQPWGFIIVSNSQLLEKISLKSKAHFLNSLDKNEHKIGELKPLLENEEFNIFYNAPVLIIICAREDENISMKEETSPEADCFLAGENLMLAAIGMGLGTCPIGLSLPVLRTNEIRTTLDIPKGYLPVLPIVVGYPSDNESYVERQRPLIKWIH
ncbi:nitroreductase [Bacteriovorax sp. PP10]|uniref:Nitroreductase n=1 Tax=Bacteriovorax antarcticus TaxID=3088717 RepID=A0ABU5VZ36_9BACT|nr:nitroreductase [Bacteriovorax sp. PP10]MEA9357857.1 nitroreductase [Bacteriovorax sp. PP10]